MIPTDVTHIVSPQRSNPTREALRTVHLRNIPKNSTESSITNMCKAHGGVFLCLVGPDSEDQTKTSAFVVFKTEEEAVYAVSKLHKSRTFEGCDEPITATICRKDNSERQERFVFVLNLPDRFQSVALYRIFCQFGKIGKIYVLQDNGRILNLSRCFAVVEYVEAASAVEAVEKMDGTVLCGHQLIVKLKGDHHVCREREESVVDVPNERIQESQDETVLIHTIRDLMYYCPNFVKCLTTVLLMTMSCLAFFIFYMILLKLTTPWKYKH